jgi:hypothetical protein
MGDVIISKSGALLQTDTETHKFQATYGSSFHGGCSIAVALGKNKNGMEKNLNVVFGS